MKMTKRKLRLILDEVMVLSADSKEALESNGIYEVV
jgi:hypothetical protein